MNVGVIEVFVVGALIAGAFPLLFLPLFRRAAQLHRRMPLPRTGTFEVEVRKARKGLLIVEKRLERVEREEAKHKSEATGSGVYAQ
jgi:hypothetical protein